MRQWIYEKLSRDEWWLSYHPGLLILGLNSVILAWNLYHPQKWQWLTNCLILVGSFGIAWSMKIIYGTYQWKKQQAQFRSEMEQFINSLRSDIEAIMNEEMNVSNRDENRSIEIAQIRIGAFIQSERERHKIGLNVSNSDKT